MPDNGKLDKAWTRITGQEVTVGRAGYIPVKVGPDWLMFRNTYTIYEGVEDRADPQKVETLRLTAFDLVNRYPQTIEGLERLGIRVKRVLNRPIHTPDDVAAWAESIFNVGPTGKTEKGFNTQALLPVKAGRVKETPEPILPEPEPVPPPPKLLPTEKITPSGKRLGRPRKDGLLQGSAEARAADAQKKKEYQAARRRAAREAAATKSVATVTAISHSAPRRLVRRSPKTA